MPESASQKGVTLAGGGGLLGRGVSLARGGLLGRGVVSQHALRQTSPTVDRITDTSKKHNLGHNFVAAGKYYVEIKRNKLFYLNKLFCRVWMVYCAWRSDQPIPRLRVRTIIRGVLWEVFGTISKVGGRNSMDWSSLSVFLANSWYITISFTNCKDFS